MITVPSMFGARLPSLFKLRAPCFLYPKITVPEVLILPAGYITLHACPGISVARSLFTAMLSRSLVTLVLALACAAHPLFTGISSRSGKSITIPMTKRINLPAGSTILEYDRARFEALGAATKSPSNYLGKRDAEAALNNTAVSYTTQVCQLPSLTHYSRLKVYATSLRSGVRVPFVSITSVSWIHTYPR